MEKYYQEAIECASREEIRAIQDEKLVKQIRHVWDNVPYYRKKMEEKGLTPDDIEPLIATLRENKGEPFGAFQPLTMDDARAIYASAF